MIVLSNIYQAVVAGPSILSMVYVFVLFSLSYFIFLFAFVMFFYGDPWVLNSPADQPFGELLISMLDLTFFWVAFSRLFGYFYLHIWHIFLSFPNY